MSRSSDIFVMFNPSSGRGSGARRVEPYLARLQSAAGAVDWKLTTYPGHERELIAAACDAGYRTIVAVGGDGTWSAAADGIVRSRRRDIALGLLPAGTGNDFGKSIGVRVDTTDPVIGAIAARRTRTIDVGRVGERYFLNVVGMGFDIAVIDDALRTPILKGDALYRFCAIKQLFRYRGIPLTVRDGTGVGLEHPHLMLVISNANYFGGSFHIAPLASLQDGKLDAVSIHDAGPFERARLFGKVSRGDHQSEARVTIRQHARFEIHFPGNTIRYEVDGEVLEWTRGPLVVESVPAALEVCVP